MQKHIEINQKIKELYVALHKAKLYSNTAERTKLNRAGRRLQLVRKIVNS